MGSRSGRWRIRTRSRTGYTGARFSVRRSLLWRDCVAYTLLTGWFNATGYHGGTGFDLKCYLLPWVCGDGPREAAAEQAKARKWRVIYFSPVGHGKKKECSCHYDIRRGGKVEHLRQWKEMSCDSDRIGRPGTWTPVLGMFVKLQPVTASRPVTEPTVNIIHSDGTGSVEPARGLEYWYHCE